MLNLTKCVICMSLTSLNEEEFFVFFLRTQFPSLSLLYSGLGNLFMKWNWYRHKKALNLTHRKRSSTELQTVRGLSLQVEQLHSGSAHREYLKVVDVLGLPRLTHLCSTAWAWGALHVQSHTCGGPHLLERGADVFQPSGDHPVPSGGAITEDIYTFKYI